ncbi:hypothetical protein DMH01_14950 [Amycolatopsis sp. WAC 04182]|uniref:helix-turn-helix transcriptional regulator n=1 Tax=Amycolatopsis sp. WAC 04182 TaxID=2203198 RepID=UPI000F7A74BB|nr:hypothetical protein [Amycolatopsis sp. WAC 04182]RSN60595.1 hypothetical protein DMH01_14950 [Amycolatopsis sp. WAC 04182]
MLIDVVARSGLSRGDFAVPVGYPAAKMGRVLNGSTRISPDLAHAVAQRYTIDPLDLLIRQNRTALATVADREHLAATAGSAAPLSRHPVYLDVDDNASAIDVIRAVIAATGLSNSRFAVTLGYDPTSISKILNGHKAVTAALAHSLGRRYGVDAEDLLARQSRWQLAAAAERTQTAGAPSGRHRHVQTPQFTRNLRFCGREKRTP